MGAESLRGDLRSGHPWRLVNLLIGGLVCGLLWECWNYWARTKWIYTVPVPPDIKLFEMPLAGYLGFPGLRRRMLRDVRLRPAVDLAWRLAPDRTIIGASFGLDPEPRAARPRASDGWGSGRSPIKRGAPCR